jgi:hypothetical protein
VGKRRFSTDNSWINERCWYLYLTSLTINDLFVFVVQLGTSESYSAVLPNLSSKAFLCNRITSLHLNSAYVMAPPVHKEMSQSMQSMPQLFNIFRFAALLARSYGNCLPIYRLASDLPKITICVLLSNHLAMIIWVVLLQDIRSSSGPLI